MQIAVYLVPFPDFDYVKLATDCGVKTAFTLSGPGSLDAVFLVVAAPQAVIDTLSANLDFAPENSWELAL